MTERPWNGWAKGPAGRLWHRVEWDNRTKHAVFACTGHRITAYPEDVIDYRAVPSMAERCFRCAGPGWTLNG